MFFDRNEIHIQVGVLFSNGNVSFSIPHLRKIVFKIYTQKTHKKIRKKNEKIEKIWYLGPTDFENFQFLMSQIDKNNIFPG